MLCRSWGNQSSTIDVREEKCCWSRILPCQIETKLHYFKEKTWCCISCLRLAKNAAKWDAQQEWRVNKNVLKYTKVYLQPCWPTLPPTIQMFNLTIYGPNDITEWRSRRQNNRIHYTSDRSAFYSERRGLFAVGANRMGYKECEVRTSFKASSRRLRWHLVRRLHRKQMSLTGDI